MTIGEKRRMTGMLTTTDRGLALKPDSGGLLELDTEPVHIKLIGQRVIVGGTETAWNRLAVDTIEFAKDHEGDARSIPQPGKI